MFLVWWCVCFTSQLRCSCTAAAQFFRCRSQLRCSCTAAAQFFRCRSFSDLPSAPLWHNLPFRFRSCAAAQFSSAPLQILSRLFGMHCCGIIFPKQILSRPLGMHCCGTIFIKNTIAVDIFS